MIESKSWTEARETARHYVGQEVLYCLAFSHGLMKVGRTKSMTSRLESLSAHGLLKTMTVNLFVQPVEHCAIDAEKIALKRFAELAKQHAAEVFDVVDTELVRSVLMEAAKSAKKKSPKPDCTDAGFDELSRASGMYSAMIHLAIERAKETGMHERAEELTSIVSKTPPGQLNEVVRKMLGKSESPTNVTSCK